MPDKILLHRKLRTFSSAAEDETNLLVSVEHERQTERLRQLLWDQRDSIATLVGHHLGLRTTDVCTVLPPSSWITGGFNLCVILEVKYSRSTQRLVFRCPMPHKLAEDRYPGTIDEKLSCEAATYIWMQEYCADIRFPHLYAFGFASRSHFTHINQHPFYTQIFHAVRRWMNRYLHRPLLSDYIKNATAPTVDTGYMLMEYIEPEIGKMLSCTWQEHSHDTNRRNNLYRGMSRVMLSLARLPQPHIGSFRFNTSDGTISLSNRPLIATMMIFENSGVPRSISPGQVYQSTDSFSLDMLTLHDNHLFYDEHAVRDEEDAHERMAIRTLLRATSHSFILPDRRRGPFLLQPTDLHQSNIFVDDDWNVTCLVDLEWICALPVEMMSVPYWITNCAIDEIIDEKYSTFNEARRVFLAIMDEERMNVWLEHDINITDTMKNVWASKGVWFWACIRSLNAWPFLFEDHILPKFSTTSVAKLKYLSMFWKEDIGQVVKAKVDDEKRYLAKLRSRFEHQS